jgi:SAM-dependent methyltransferase
MTEPDRAESIVRHVADPRICCDPEWEAAYKRFETPEQEIAKFIGRLKRFGFDRLSRQIRIAEVFCGRGGGLVALERMGFQQLVGIDLSETLLRDYRGSATLHLADCIQLPFAARTFDAVIVHGGLHHLPQLPSDLDSTLAEIARILKPWGQFYAVEPWRTPFLSLVHCITNQTWVRRMYAKGDALATMTEREWTTYSAWLANPNIILATFDKYFVATETRIRWGKLAYAGRVKADNRNQPPAR